MANTCSSATLMEDSLQVLLPGLDGTDLFVVAVHIVVVQGDDSGLSWGGEDNTRWLKVNDGARGLGNVVRGC